jgi:carbonic anhydrase
MSNPHNISRRNLIKYGSIALGTTAAVGSLGALPNITNAQPVSTKLAQNIPQTPDQALSELLAGNQRFVIDKRTSPNITPSRLTEVAAGQNPFAAVLSCADSRVPVEIVFDQGLGDIFVVRVAGNIATSEEIGSLEFGTAVLGAKVLLIIGHGACGAVASTIAGKPVPGQIGSILTAIQPAVDQVKDKPGDALLNATRANVLWQKSQLEKSPVIAGLIKEGKLTVVGAYYDLDTGEVSLVNEV